MITAQKFKNPDPLHVSSVKAATVACSLGYPVKAVGADGSDKSSGISKGFRTQDLAALSCSSASVATTKRRATTTPLKVGVACEASLAAQTPTILPAAAFQRSEQAGESTCRALDREQLSATGDAEEVLRALGNEASGYIPKTMEEKILLGALKLLLTTGACLPWSDSVMRRRASGFNDQRGEGQEGLMAKTAATPSDLGLTPRETDVLRVLVQGKPNKIIGRELNIAESTVKIHAQSVCRKLKVTRRTEAIVAAGKMGLFPGETANRSPMPSVDTTLREALGANAN